MSDYLKDNEGVLWGMTLDLSTVIKLSFDHDRNQVAVTYLEAPGVESAVTGPLSPEWTVFYNRLNQYRAAQGPDCPPLLVESCGRVVSGDGLPQQGPPTEVLAGKEIVLRRIRYITHFPQSQRVTLSVLTRDHHPEEMLSPETFEVSASTLSDEWTRFNQALVERSHVTFKMPPIRTAASEDAVDLAAVTFRDRYNDAIRGGKQTSNADPGPGEPVRSHKDNRYQEAIRSTAGVFVVSGRLDHVESFKDHREASLSWAYDSYNNPHLRSRVTYLPYQGEPVDVTPPALLSVFKSGAEALYYLEHFGRKLMPDRFDHQTESVRARWKRLYAEITKSPVIGEKE